jgi:acetyltransferase-like isoleucine patch superfamily enzyme
MLGGFRHRLRLLPSVFFRLELLLRGVKWCPPLHLVGRPWLSLASGSEISLEPGVTLDSSRRANPLGGSMPCILKTLASKAIIHLGKEVGVSSSSLVAGNRIEIGEGTLVGAGGLIMDNDLHKLDPRGRWQNEYVQTSRPIKIGRNCFIGARAIILKGVTLDDHVVIGAGAVVTKSFGPGAVVAGNPGRQVGTLPGV